jgi:glycosyltransferase involved in cell wall biosynthesis
MSMKISIIIPTYNRPDLLIKCIKSCLSQTLRPFEIIIGDDSINSDSTGLVEQLIKENKCIEISYYKHWPAKGQIGNVNFLIHKVKGDYVTLIHDDDYLLNNCLDDLSKPMIADVNIDASFGKQYIVDMVGGIDIEKSDNVNKDYYRTAYYSGSVLNSYQSGILQQFPNNAYLIKTDLIQIYNYSTDIDYVGDACDFFFAFNLGMKNLKFHFVNKYTAAYRVGNEKVGSGSQCDAALKSYFIIRDSVVPVGETKKSYNQQLIAKAPVALAQAISRKEKSNGLKIYFSRNHMIHLLSLGGIKRTLMLFKLLLTT